jgi:hypothetical protein
MGLFVLGIFIGANVGFVLMGLVSANRDNKK